MITKCLTVHGLRAVCESITIKAQTVSTILHLLSMHRTAAHHYN